VAKRHDDRDTCLSKRGRLEGDAEPIERAQLAR
jgi:hypothetical protein